MISPTRFFEIYTAVVLHFKGGAYDFFKYGGTVKNITETSFLKRKDKYVFERLAKRCDNEQHAVGICVANHIAGNSYIRNFQDTAYLKWKAYADSMDYSFSNELEKYLEEKKKTDKPLPLLLKMVHTKKLSKEFLILFDITMDGFLFKTLDNDLDDTAKFLWDDIKQNILLYKPFYVTMNLDENKIQLLKKATLKVA